jgi:hypothetical protein
MKYNPELPLDRLLGVFEHATLITSVPRLERTRLEIGSISVYFAAMVCAVSTLSLFRDFPPNTYCVFALRPLDVHGVLFCRHPEVVPCVLLEKYNPEFPLVKLLGILAEETLIPVCVTPVKASVETGSMAVLLSIEIGVLSMLSPLRDFPLKAYCVLALSPIELQGMLSCCHPEFVPAVVFAK